MLGGRGSGAWCPPTPSQAAETAVRVLPLAVSASDGVEGCCAALRALLPTVLPDDRARRQFVDELVVRALRNPAHTEAYARLCKRIAQDESPPLAPGGGDPKGPFRMTLLNLCEERFRHVATEPEQRAVCLARLVGLLHRHGVVRGRIVHSCIVRVLFGSEVSRDHLPSAVCVAVACTLLDLCAPLLARSGRRQLTSYARHLEALLSRLDPAVRQPVRAVLEQHRRGWPPPSDATLPPAGPRCPGAGPAPPLLSPPLCGSHPPVQRHDPQGYGYAPQPQRHGNVYASPPLASSGHPSPLVHAATPQRFPRAGSAGDADMSASTLSCYSIAASSAAADVAAAGAVSPPTPSGATYRHDPYTAAAAAVGQPPPSPPRGPPPGHPPPEQYAQQRQQGRPRPLQGAPCPPQSGACDASAHAAGPTTSATTTASSFSSVGAPSSSGDWARTPSRPQTATTHSRDPPPRPAAAAPAAAAAEDAARPRRLVRAYTAPVLTTLTEEAAPPAAATCLTPPAPLLDAPARQDDALYLLDWQGDDPEGRAAPAEAKTPKGRRPRRGRRQRSGCSSPTGGAPLTPQLRTRPGPGEPAPVPEAPAVGSIFSECRTKRERRQVGNLVISKSLQLGYNRTYGAARRKLTKWCQQNAVIESDLLQLVEYLNELYLAGMTYDGVGSRSYVQGELPAESGASSAASADDQDEVASVVSGGTAGTDTWREAAEDEEEEECAAAECTVHGPRTGHLRESALRRLQQQQFPRRGSTCSGSSFHSAPDGAGGLQSRSPSCHGFRSPRSTAAESTVSRGSRSYQYGRIPEDLTLDDRVVVKRLGGDAQAGLVRYIGFPGFQHKGPDFEGCWVGVTLDEPRGNHDGTVDGVRYFIAPQGHGVFCREDKIVRQKDGVEGPLFFYPQHLTRRLLRYDIRPEALKPFGFRCGDRVASSVTPPGQPAVAGTVIGVRHGLLHWHLDGGGVTGASAVRPTAKDIVDTFKRKKYKKVGQVDVMNHVDEAMRLASPMGPLPPPAGAPALPRAVEQLVDGKWEGSLRAETPAEGHQRWLRKLLRRDTVKELRKEEKEQRGAKA